MHEATSPRNKIKNSNYEHSTVNFLNELGQSQAMDEQDQQPD